MTRIAERAQLSKAALYVYFASKEEIFFTILLDYFRDAMTEVFTADALYDQEYPPASPLAAEYQALIGRHIDALSAIIAEGVCDGSIGSHVDPRTTACMIGNVISLFGGTTSVRRKILTHEQGVDPVHEYSLLLTIIDRYLQAPASGGKDHEP